MSKPGERFEDSMQHVDFQPNAVVHYARCESCMYGSPFDEPTWHSWAGPDDMRDDDPEYNARVKTQKCHCDCAGPLDHAHQDSGRHNHFTRDVKAPGKCPRCDELRGQA